jgi:hypothetical protein
VASAGIEVVRDVVDARIVIGLYQDLDAFESLPHRIFVSGKQIDW